MNQEPAPNWLILGLPNNTSSSSELGVSEMVVVKSKALMIVETYMILMLVILDVTLGSVFGRALFSAAQ